MDPVQVCPIRDSLEACSFGDVGVLQFSKTLSSPQPLYMGLVDDVLSVTASRVDALQLRLVHRSEEGCVALQAVDHSNGFVSPVELADLHSRWTLRSVADAWETLQVTLNPGGWFLSVRSPPAPAPLATAAGGGSSCVPGVPDPDHPAVGYLSPLLLEPGAPLIRRTAPCFDGWEAVVFRLTQVPVVNVSPLVGRALAHLRPEVAEAYGPSEVLAFVDHVTDLPEAARLVVYRLAKATRDVGFYHIIGHGVPLDVLALAKASAVGISPSGTLQERMLWESGPTARSSGGAMPPSGDWPGRPPTLATGKTYIRHHLTDVPLEVAPPMLPLGTPPSVVVEYVGGVMALEKQLLHALALAQAALPSASPPSWRYVAAPRPTMDGQGALELGGFMALRVLRYPPSPAGASGGAVGMGMHRDATWLTLLATDETGGLVVTMGDGSHSSHFVDVRSVPGALLVNAGMALQDMSDGFYRAVCHGVVRKDPTVTRVSVAFFYDACDKSRTVGGCMPPH